MARAVTEELYYWGARQMPAKDLPALTSEVAAIMKHPEKLAVIAPDAAAAAVDGFCHGLKDREPGLKDREPKAPSIPGFCFNRE